MCERDQFVWDSEICFGVLGNDGQFRLFEVTAGPLDMQVVADAVSTGYAFCGLVGLRQGFVLTHHEPDPDSWLTVARASHTVARILAERFDPKGSVAWLELLYALPDTRQPHIVAAV